MSGGDEKKNQKPKVDVSLVGIAGAVARRIVNVNREGAVDASGDKGRAGAKGKAAPNQKKAEAAKRGAVPKTTKKVAATGGTAVNQKDTEAAARAPVPNIIQKAAARCVSTQPDNELPAITEGFRGRLTQFLEIEHRIRMLQGNSRRAQELGSGKELINIKGEIEVLAKQVAMAFEDILVLEERDRHDNEDDKQDEAAAF